MLKAKGGLDEGISKSNIVRLYSSQVDIFNAAQFSSVTQQEG